MGQVSKGGRLAEDGTGREWSINLQTMQKCSEEKMEPEAISAQQVGWKDNIHIVMNWCAFRPLISKLFIKTNVL